MGVAYINFNLTELIPCTNFKEFSDYYNDSYNLYVLKTPFKNRIKLSVDDLVK